MVQDEVTWLLETIADRWPEPRDTGQWGEGLWGEGLWFSSTGGIPDDLARINRDEPKILETGERTRSVELEKWNAFGASLANRTTEPVGTEYDHRVETAISCRLEALHSAEWGNVNSAAHFEQLVRYVQHAIASRRTYPTLDNTDRGDIGSVEYHSLFIENEQDLSHERKDYFRRDWDVRLIGYSELP